MILWTDDDSAQWLELRPSAQRRGSVAETLISIEERGTTDD